MSTRMLSAYFDDVRKGRKDVAQVRQFLLDTFAREPVKRGHLLHWLDQAQYEHPIPVTDFLLLRKEIEAVVKNNWNSPPVDDATVIASPGPIAAPDSETLMAATAATTPATEVTQIAGATMGDEGATRIVRASDDTPLPERSDHAGQHDAATTIHPRAVEPTPPASPARSPARSQALSRRFLALSGVALALLAILGALALKYWLRQQAEQDASQHQAALTQVNQALTQAPAGSIGNPTNAADTTGTTATAALSDMAMTTSEPVNLETLSEQELQQEILQRAEAGDLLPASASGSAYEALRVLSRRFPQSEGIVLARIAIKNAHLKQSDAARARGEWELAQQHLDAAFDVLQQASN